MVKILLTQIFILSVIYFLIITSLQANEWEHMAKGASLQKQGKIQEAINEYEEALKGNPHFVEAYSSLGYIYQYELKNYSKAIKIYLQGIEYASHDYGLNLNIMYSYFDQGNTRNGIKHYEVLSKIRSRNQRFSFPRETIHKIIRDMRKENVINFCKKYLALNPTDTMLREILVDIYKKQKDYKSAESELQAMLQYGNKTSSVYFDLGTCNYNLGRHKKALEFFSKAKQLGAYVPQEFFDRLHKRIGNGVRVPGRSQ